ncbi:MmgE/PrpD family protein [Pelagibacterales bacterium SAG-MED27]|nr:MmgE/PrpD family protein [Pelagibacterales bacterium SAG-MED27]
MTIAEEFSSWSKTLSVKDIPEKTQSTLKFLLKDICGIILSARNENYVKSLVETYKGSGNLVSLGHSERFDLFSSAIIAGTAAHGEDFDDTFEGNPMHVGATMIPAMLSAAQKFNLNGDQILKGLTIGSELICRLALVAPTAMHKQSFHPTAVCGTFGVAAGLSSVLDLTEKQMVSALGIAGSFTSGIIEYLAEGSWTKRVHPGWSANSGMNAALIAKSGFYGPRTVFEGEHGFFEAFALKEIERDYSHLTDGLGKRWENQNLAFKPFACGTMAQPFVDCAIKIRKKIKNLNNISSITAKVGEGTVHRLWEPLKEKKNPSTPYSAKFSVPYCVAVGFIRGDAGLNEFNEKSINDKEILNLASKVNYEIDPNNEYPKNYTGTLICKTSENEFTEHQPCFRGGIKEPLTKDDIDKKYNANLNYSKISEENKKNLNSFIETLFTKPDFSKINF